MRSSGAEVIDGLLHNKTFVAKGIRASSYPQPPNLCTEAVTDRAMITCMLAH